MIAPERSTKRLFGMHQSQRFLLILALGASLQWLTPIFTAPAFAETPSIDGTENNLDEPEMNAASTPLKRSLPADYSDATNAMAGGHRRSPREISNLVNAQEEFRPNRRRASGFVFQWGQFVDHDIDLTGTSPAEPVPIAVPENDPYFDPEGLGNVTIEFNRSVYDQTTGDSAANPRQQMNQITGWIDGSSIYGSDEGRSEALRTLDGTGRLRTQAGDFLPFNDAGLPNDTGGSIDRLFLAGDVRANEQVGLTALHTLFVREHNRLASQLAADDPSLSGDMIYEKARRMVVAFLQAITYREFLPALLGRKKALGRYSGYDPSVDARISNSFSTAAFRLGHSMLPPQLLRLDRNLREVSYGHLPLRDAFFSPAVILYEGGIDPLLRGLAYQVQQDVDVFIVDEVRNFLFGAPGAGGFDLASLNIQRGRDHGLPDYNTARVKYGLEPVQSFEEISSDPEVVERLKTAYEHVEYIDLWVGGLAEDHMPKALVGPLFYRIIVKQFKALRDGDRFFYKNQLSRREIRRVNRTKLSHIIRRNTTIRKEIPRNVFRVRRWRRWLANASGEWPGA